MDSVDVIDIVTDYIKQHGETCSDIIIEPSERQRRKQLKYLLFEAMEFALLYSRKDA
ncbi:MAG TPA: hypothetical protein VNW06_03400 [Cytophagaceae bacterium]|nr:hypothetical protein [Cytophagaceae bacterium]